MEKYKLTEDDIKTLKDYQNLPHLDDILDGFKYKIYENYINRFNTMLFSKISTDEYKTFIKVDKIIKDINNELSQMQADEISKIFRDFNRR